MRRDTRDRLLGAAGELLAEQGYGGTSIAEILVRAGALSGSLYHSFRSKEALALAVLEDWGLRRVRELADAAEAAESEPLARVLALVELYRQRVAEGWPPAAQGRLAAELRTLRPEVAAAVRRDGERLAARIRDWLDQAGPRLPGGTDRDGLARFIVLVAEGAAVHARLEGTVAAFEVATAQLRAYLAMLEDAASGRRPAAPVPAEPAEPLAAPSAAGDPTGWRSW